MKAIYVTFFIILCISNSKSENYFDIYKRKRLTHSNISVGVTYFPGVFRKIDFSASELKLGFPIVNFSCNYNILIDPLYQLGFLFDYFYGSGHNVSKVNNYDLKTFSKRNGFYFGIAPNVCIHINKKIAINYSPSIRIGRATDSLVGTTVHNGVKNTLFHFNLNDVSIAFVTKILFEIFLKEKYSICTGVLYQVSTILNEELWETNDIGYNDPNNPSDFGRGFGIVIEYKLWFKKKKKEKIEVQTTTQQ